MVRRSDAFERAPVACAVLDDQGHLVAANRAARALLQRQADEVTGVALGDLLVEPQALRQHLAHAATATAPVEVDLSLARPEGQPTPVRLISELDHDERGARVYRVALLRQGVRSRPHTHRLQSAIDGVPDPILVVGFDHRIQLMNRAVRERYLDDPDAPDAGRHCYELSHARETPCDGTEHPCPLEHVRQHGTPVRVVHTHQDRDGLPRYVELVAAPVFEHDGSVSSMIETVRDITEQRKLEEELARADRLDAVGLLAGGIAHDFNNLLMIMSGNLALLDDPECSADDRREALADARDAGERARGLTQQLLTFSRGGAPVRAAAEVDEIVRESARFALRGSHVGYREVVTGDLWPADADADQLNQVFNNLFLNAVQAMPGGGEVTATLRNHEVGPDNLQQLVPGRYLQVEIADTGAGISDADLRRVFDPFFTTKAKGTGLGLATCHSVVRQHGGRIHIESAPGAGTRVTVLVPAADQPAPRDERDREAPAREPTRPARILVMDDELPIRRVAARIMSRCGWETTLAADGEEAVEVARRALAADAPFDLAILDLTVPGGSGGVETAKRLRALDPRVRLVVSSGYSADPVLSAHARHGFDAVLTKPYQPDDLREVVGRLLTE